MGGVSMRYFKQLKMDEYDRETEFEITEKEALQILKDNYSGNETLKNMLRHEQIIPCMFCYIIIKNEP
jgi:hypothetical protein